MRDGGIAVTREQRRPAWAAHLGVRQKEPLAKHCTYEVGGPAEYFCEPENFAQLQEVLAQAKAEGIPVTIIGKGSNLLISDQGVKGLVVCLADRLAKRGFLKEKPERTSYEVILDSLSADSATPAKPDDEGYVWYFAEAGASMIEVAKECSSKGFTGLEFATGIPGTVGGALYMNAGAYGGMTADVAEITWYLTAEGDLRSAVWDEQKFGYRRSYFQDVGAIVLATAYRLQAGDPAEIQATVEDLTTRREKSQPLELPSCGSVFKRPEGYYAGKLIMDSGLQGYRIGGAEVSKKHAGFIVNVGGAKAQDIADLIHYIQRTVKNRFEVQLETEVRYLGEW